MIKTQTALTCSFAICMSLLVSCKSNPGQDENQNQSSATDTAAPKDTTPMNELASFKFSYTIANLPSPLEVINEFSSSNLPVDVTLLNPVDNSNNYQSSLKQAFNYGVYGVDLGYLVVNNRTLDVLKYYSTSKKLAEELNLSETFNRFVNRFESNSNQKDSLTRVIDEAYAATDAYLRSNERLQTASEVLAGSWLEAQHITVNLLKNADRNPDNEKLFQRVWEQRLYLDNISKLLEEFKGDKQLSKIKNDFESLLVIYKEPRDATGINKEFLAKLSSKLDKVRDNIIE
jgi:hypothetical protein